MWIAICDDEKRFLNDLSEIIRRHYHSLDIAVNKFSSGSELLQSFYRVKYDIVFLDIEMPGLDGISLARKIRELSEDVYIVFLTGHIEYALKGYEVNALRYLTKPATDASVHEVLDQVLKKQSNEKSLWLKNRDGERRIRLSEIVFIEAQDQNIVFYTPSDSFEIRGKLNDYEQQLKQEGFFRIHRSYIVSLSKISGVTGKEITVTGGYRLPVARAKEREFRDAFMSYISKEAF
ncbi:MAG: response regulator transcription factor [Oscillospiraceae bacterium]|nr:response regulator transcription factor [Oscillospiraceae bacterium]